MTSDDTTTRSRMDNNTQSYSRWQIVKPGNEQSKVQTLSSRIAHPIEWGGQTQPAVIDVGERGALAVDSSAVCALDVVDKWLLDSGASRDIIGDQHANQYSDQLYTMPTVTLATATGKITSNTGIILQLPGGTEASAYVFKGTPPALSMGIRIMNQDCR